MERSLLEHASESFERVNYREHFEWLSNFSQQLVVSNLRTLTCSCSTNARCQKEERPFTFGCSGSSDDPDAMSHYLWCSSFWKVIYEVCVGFAPSFDLYELLGFIPHRVRLSVSILLPCFIILVKIGIT